MDKLLARIPATYAPARSDVAPFSLVVLPPGTMEQDKAEVQKLEHGQGL